VHALPNDHDKAAALAAYARERDDTELEKVWTREIEARACIRIGELSMDLEKAQHGGARGGSVVPSAGLSKGGALKDAGLSKSTANRYEVLTGGRDQRGRAAAPLGPRSSRPGPGPLPRLERFDQQLIQSQPAVRRGHPELALELRRHLEIHWLIRCGGRDRPADLSLCADQMRGKVRGFRARQLYASLPFCPSAYRPRCFV
jgi:hypothetical protein